MPMQEVSGALGTTAAAREGTADTKGNLLGSETRTSHPLELYSSIQKRCAAAAAS